MTQLLSLNAEQQREMSSMRRFFRERNISETIRSRIWSCYRQQKNIRKNNLQKSDVAYFAWMPKRLKLMLDKELYTHYLHLMLIFRRVEEVSSHHDPFLCHAAMTEVNGSPLEEIFHPGKEATCAMCLTVGQLQYKTRRLTEDLDVGVEEWVSEAAIWGKWVHTGVLSAQGPCRWIQLSVEIMRNELTASAAPPVLRMLREYAILFVAHVSASCMLDVRVESDTEELNDIARAVEIPSSEVNTASITSSALTGSASAIRGVFRFNN